MSAMVAWTRSAMCTSSVRFKFECTCRADMNETLRRSFLVQVVVVVGLYDAFDDATRRDATRGFPDAHVSLFCE